MPKMSKELQAIEITKIIPNDNQPRKIFNDDTLDELASSIKAVGIIQPLTVREQADGKYMLISGERRLRAANIAGLKSVPCVLLKGEEEDFELMSLIENIQREDISFIEEANAYKKLIEAYSITQQQLAQKVGKTQSTVANKLRLLKLGDEVTEKVLKYEFTERHARILLTIPDTDMRLKAADIIHKRNLNVKQAEELVKKLKSEVLFKNDKDSIKSYFNYKIYTNTIKKAYESIVQSGLGADYTEKRYDDRLEVVITIPIEEK